MARTVARAIFGPTGELHRSIIPNDDKDLWCHHPEAGETALDIPWDDWLLITRSNGMQPIPALIEFYYLSRKK